MQGANLRFQNTLTMIGQSFIHPAKVRQQQLQQRQQQHNQRYRSSLNNRIYRIVCRGKADQVRCRRILLINGYPI